MTVTVEFVGGLHDGDIRDMPDDRDEWLLPDHRLSLTGFAEARIDQPYGQLRRLVYRRANLPWKVMEDADTGKLVSVRIYELVRDDA